VLQGECIVRVPHSTTFKKSRSVRERGSTYAEAAIITPCFLIVVLMSIQFMIISFRAVTLQWITTKAMRHLALWEVNTDGTTTTSPSQSHAFAYRQVSAFASAVGIRNIPQSAFCVQNLDNPGGCTTTWSAGDTLQLQVTYTIPLFFTRLLFVQIPTQTVTGTAVAVVENLPQNN
jgi:hypothetical protein